MASKKYIGVLVVLIAAFETAVALANGKITGVVYYENAGEPVDYASVVLLDKVTGKLLPIGTSTDENGRFELADVDGGEYVVRISSVGAVTSNNDVTVGDGDVDMGKIMLHDNVKMLQEVTVTGERSQIKLDSDKRVFNVASNIGSTGASAEELIASVPSVTVSGNGAISLRGNSDVTVWINGRETAMNDDNRTQILRQIPAESVESIEVMTNPSAKHSSEGTAGIINIVLKESRSKKYYGSADVNADTRGSVNLNGSISYNSGKVETYAGIGLKSERTPGGVVSRRNYDDGNYLNSTGNNKNNENSAFLNIGVNYKLDQRNLLYASAIGTLGHKWGRNGVSHLGNIPGQWDSSESNSSLSGDTKGANVMAGYRRELGPAHYLDVNASYNFWQGQQNSLTHDMERGDVGQEVGQWQNQHQDVKISNWEVAADYSIEVNEKLRVEAGFKGNYNRENSPAYYESGAAAGELKPRNDLFNRFKYDNDISALYVNFSGEYGHLTYSAGLRGELWQIRTHSLGFGETDRESDRYERTDFALFPTVSVGWRFKNNNELKLNYSRRINRPFGPQLNTFENISDPSEVHIGNPLIHPEYSNGAELTYIRSWSDQMLSVSGYVRSNSDMISHVSFLAPMISDASVTTMYYGHANVGNMTNAGIEMISRNTILRRMTLTTTVNIYNSHLKGWDTEYPLHGGFYNVYGAGRDRVVWDGSCMVSVRLPWSMTFQATGRYGSRRITAQGTVEPTWDVEAGLRKSAGSWNVSLVCKDIFDSRRDHDVLYGNGYTQSIRSWSGGRTLRLSVGYVFGKSSGHGNERHNHIDTGGYDGGHTH